jgi:signal transduction histidine kinase
MSLRLRLTLLYSTMVGGLLVVFGLSVYLLISFFLLSQVDATMARVATEIVDMSRVDSVGNLGIINLPPLDVTENTYIQFLGPDGRIELSSPSIGFLGKPLDPTSLQAAEPAYTELFVAQVHMRVLTVPLRAGDEPVGVLQVGSNLGMLDATRDELLVIMLVAAVIAVVLAGLGSYVVLGRVLAPLGTITRTVDQINRADDLSRRIPYRGLADDEVGSLVEAINQTLERLEEIFTSQRRFLADVSHELRTPLTVIKGSVDLMRRMKTVDEESLGTMDQEAGRLTRLVGGLLLLAQAESGRLALQAQPLELDQLLFEVFHEINVIAGGRVQLRMNEVDQVQLPGDRDRLKQVFLNLLGNAIQYTPPGGSVFVSLARIGEQARVIVRDTGPGIPADDLPHIFERFYRAEKSRTRGKSGGFGLGLSIANWIVESHGGRIQVESKEGKGTTFAVWLPAPTRLTSETSPFARESQLLPNRR